jgi:hypothetical protein
MEQRLKINLTLPIFLTDNVREFASQNNYIRLTDAVRYLIGSGLRREIDRGTVIQTQITTKKEAAV